jgi:hypothetical protein
MASGSNRSVFGSFVGTGAQLDIKTIGFRPSLVKLWNETGLVTAEWTKTMADAAGMKRVTAGDLTKMSAGITPLADGFRVGTDADLNVAAEKVHYMVED